MDESAIWLKKLLEQVKGLKLERSASDAELEQVLLYSLGAQLIDWRGDTRFIKASVKGSESSLSWSSKVQLLVEYCKHSKVDASFDLEGVEKISSLLIDWVKSRDSYECLALFDALFYRNIDRAGFSRRNADFVSELTVGLSGSNGIRDLYAYNGEAIVRHSSRYRNSVSYEVSETEAKLQHLTFLRLVIRDINLRRISRAEKNGVANLTLLDHYALLNLPFTQLFQLVLKDGFVGQALVVFQVTNGRNDPLQRQVRRLLSERDLLEVVFDFTSYNLLGKPVRYNAWLLNSNKNHARKTLCVDTRDTLESIKIAGSHHVAALAASIVQIWRSKSKAVDFNDELLGPLNGLYSQWFDSGYRNVDGVCKVFDTPHALSVAVSTKRVPARANNNDIMLLDSRSLQDLLDNSQLHSFCTYVIGNNGTGKSLLLASMASSLRLQNVQCAAIAMGPQDRFPASTSNMGNYRYLGDRTESGYSLRALEAKLIKRLIEISRTPWRMEIFDHVIDLLGFKHRFYLIPKGALNDVLQPLELTDLLKPLAQQAKEIRRSRDRSLAIVRSDSTELFHFSELSSGEQQVLMLFSKIIVAAGHGTVLLIDEPEISLHVHWQQVLPHLFGVIAKETSTRLIIATHSPTLVANAQNKDDHCFLAKKQQLLPIPPERRHSVETILLEGFETYTPHNREVRERCAALVSDAILTTNQSKNIDLTQQKLLEEKLDELRDLMNASGSAHDERYIRDKQLIIQARLAIDETFKLATGRNDR